MLFKSPLLLTLCSLAVVALLAPSVLHAEPPATPDELTPDWLELSVVQRTRFEGLDGQFREGRTDDDALLLLRTLVHPRFRLGQRVTFGVELQDLDRFGLPLVIDAEPELLLDRSIRIASGRLANQDLAQDAGVVQLIAGLARLLEREETAEVRHADHRLFAGRGRRRRGGGSGGGTGPFDRTHRHHVEIDDQIGVAVLTAGEAFSEFVATDGAKHGGNLPN